MYKTILVRRALGITRQFLEEDEEDVAAATIWRLDDKNIQNLWKTPSPSPSSALAGWALRAILLNFNIILVN